MNDSLNGKSYRSKLRTTLFLTVAYGVIALLYDLQLAVVYFGTLTVGATALDAVTTKFRYHEQLIRELEEKLKMHEDRPEI